MNHLSSYFRFIGLTVASFLAAYGFTENASASNTAVSTPTFSIPFVSNTRGLYSYGLNFGVHPSATKGIDAALGETEYPPFPPGGGATMFSTVEGNTFLDLRGYTGPTQIDTYKIGFATGDPGPSNAYPMYFSWPDLHSYYSGSVHLKSDLEGSLFDVDMKAQTSYTMSSGPNGDFVTAYIYIIAEGPQSGTSLPIVSTFGYGSSASATGFQAIVNAPAAAGVSPNSVLGVVTGATTWFEYGPTKTYGSSTAPQIVPSGTSANIGSPFDPSSLPLDSRLHFRAVAQTTQGLSYGGDRILSNGNPPPEIANPADTVKYRTAEYREWADSKDQKNKRKSVKARPDKVDVGVTIVAPRTASGFTLKFGMPFTGAFYSYTGSPTPDSTFIDSLRSATDETIMASVESLSVYKLHGVGSKGKLFSLTVVWDSKPKETKVVYKKPADFDVNQLRLPMPNLHNVGENIYGGLAQTRVDITVATNPDHLGAHTVYHPKYKDVLKSLIKEKKPSDLYHTALPHCLKTFDKSPNTPILKRQKSLPPDKHNNILFADQLILKLNIAASDSGIFPYGLGDLIYDNSGVKGVSGPFDGLTLRAIADSVDKYLGCNGEVAGTEDSTEFLKVDSLINEAFSGPMDTIAWSGGKVICTGVRMLSDVPYLHSNPAAQPRVDLRRVPGAPFSSEPLEFRLEQNYPNPFNPTTLIGFRLPVSSFVTLKVYNILGEELMELVHNELMDEGDQEVEFDGANLASGVYFYRIEAQTVSDDESGARPEKFFSVKKMVLTK